MESDARVMSASGGKRKCPVISGLLKVRAGSCDECGWGHTKRIRNPKQSFERRLSRATLKHADVSPIDLSCCCQFLLRKR